MTLSLAGDFLLLCYEDESGKASVDSTRLDILVVTAALIDLCNQGILDIVNPDEGIKKQSFRLVGDLDSLEEPYRQLAEEASGKKVKNVITQMAGLSFNITKGTRFRRALLESLVNAQLLKPRDDVKVFGIFTSARYRSADENYEIALRSHLEKVLDGREEASEHDVLLLSLVQASGVVHRIMPGRNPKEFAHRVEELGSSSAITQAGRRVMQQWQQFILAEFAAIFAASFVTTAVM